MRRLLRILRLCISDPWLENGIALIITFVLLVVIVLQILGRVIEPLQFIWTEEVSRYLFIAMVFMGSAAAVSTGEHINIPFFSPKQRWTRLILQAIQTAIQLAFVAVVFWIGFKQTVVQYRLGTIGSSIAIPQYLIYGIIPVAFLIFGVRTIQAVFLSIVSAKRQSPELNPN